MKTVYIPKGETVSYETLETERLVVKGCLKVPYGIKAKTISGSGVIIASTVSADDIRVDDLEAAKREAVAHRDTAHGLRQKAFDDYRGKDILPMTERTLDKAYQ